VNELQRSLADLSQPDADAERPEPVPGKHTLIGTIQRKAGPTGPGSYEEAASLVGGGAPLHAGVQSQMETSFGADFGSVRVHEGPQAASVGALAYTQGEDVHFAPGQYDPASAGGKELIGHELTHVVQQREGRVSTPQAKGAPINSDLGLEAEADAKGAAAARGEIVGASASGPVAGGAIQKKDDPNGLTGGKVTRHDFMGGHGPNPADTAKAQADSHTDDGMSLAQQAGSIKTGSARSEAEMLAACELGTHPRFIARVSPTKDFGYGTFAKPGRPFVFATEPSDLRGLTGAHAMLKVGWTKDWIKGSIGQDISICIFDTTVAVEDPAKGTKSKVEQGRMEWPELKAQALADPKFKTATAAKGITDAELPDLFDICAKTPVNATPATPDLDKRKKCALVREIINDQYGANNLYTGMGATLQVDGHMGGREVMIRPNGTGLKLTKDNHTLVSLGTLSQHDYDSLP
jgi:hypothetical protein